MHYRSDTSRNDYEKAIIEIGTILENYNPFKSIKTFGYGALLPGTSTPSNCFPLNNNNENPEVFNVQGVLDVYYESLNSLTLSGPTVFSKIIQKAIHFATENEINKKNKYILLLIITDGIIFDWRDTMDALVASALLPISIIIFGCGKSNFEKMNELNVFPLISSLGEPSVRKNVQFLSPELIIEGKLFYTNPLKLIPTQMLQYLRLYNLKISNSEIDKEKDDFQNPFPKSNLRSLYFFLLFLF